MTSQQAPRVAVINLGCRVNRVETDLLASGFEHAGCHLSDEAQADLVVINTCAVTAEAQTKTRKSVRRAARLPQAPVVMATGCVANLFAGELRDVAPGIIVEADKSKVVEQGLLALGMGEDYVDDGGHLAMSPTPTGRMRPGVKIQDGCDNRCTFCIVWKARGPSRSLPPADIVRAVDEAVGRGAHEVVLTGINLGSYKTDDSIIPHGTLDGLLAYLLAHTQIQRLRLSSIEPPDVTEELLEVMAGSEGRVAPFLHVCLQSGCDSTLRRMGRVYDTAQFRQMALAARRHMPKIALGTDIIVGFPGETAGEFYESLTFCEEMSFAKMHVFRYSKRPGTPAASAAGQVAPQVAANRGQRMRELAQRMRHQQMTAHVGDADDVLVQSPGRAVGAHLFDVAVDPCLAVGSMQRVRFVECLSDSLRGVLT